MSKKQETIADIVAEIRGLVKPGETLNHTYELLNGLADRLEAAWKREKAAIEADALAVGGLVEKSRATAENSSAVGDAAKWREALEYVLHFDATDEAAMEDGLTDAERIAEYADHIKECQKKANAALAKPPRNCDRFQTWDEAKDAYWRKQGDPCDWRKLGAWLFAPSTEQKGEKDETQK